MPIVIDRSKAKRTIVTLYELGSTKIHTIMVDNTHICEFFSIRCESRIFAKALNDALTAFSVFSRKIGLKSAFCTYAISAVGFITIFPFDIQPISIIILVVTFHNIADTRRNGPPSTLIKTIPNKASEKANFANLFFALFSLV